MTSQPRDPEPSEPTEVDLRSLQRRTLTLLSIGQVLSGLGFAASVAVGALAAVDMAGAAWSGLAATMSTLGAALLALPLARLAMRRGRRISLSTAAVTAAVGAAVCIGAMVGRSAPALFLGLALMGAATAAGLQSRFAGTDLSAPGQRGRDLSLVVWSTTIGAVAGPNLVALGDRFGTVLGLPSLAGVFVFTLSCQLLAAALYAGFLRPDPLLVSRSIGAADAATPGVGPAVRADPRLARIAIAVTSLSHGTMVALMAMTPVHLVGEGATLSIVGFTISLHIAGMFALSPVFGIVSDRLGRLPTIAIGQTLLVAAVITTATAAHNTTVVMIGLALLGLGWSASTVAGASLLTDSAPPGARVSLQGRSDLAMNLAGALGGALAGPILAALSYPGLAWALLAPVAAAAGALGYGQRLRRAERLPRSA